MNSLLAQLKQRQIFKVATIYAVSAWPIIQIADLAVPALGLPDSVMTLLLKIFIIGFPLSLVFAWLFNFTSVGIERIKGEVKQENTSEINVKATVIIAGTLVLAVLVTLASQVWFEDHVPDEIVAIEKTLKPLDDNKKGISEEKKESIAILPFVAFSSDPEDEFFADGMVEELLNLMAKIPDLRVAARTSSFAYKGVSNKTIAEIGQELGVDIILEGSIRKNDTTNKIRVTAQLIKVSTGEHLWSETYDREYRDIFQIQDDIATAVVDKMKKTLFTKNSTIEFLADTHNVDAMVAYGKGQKELAHRTAQSISSALAHFEHAASLDDNYARAYVGIADANILLALYGNLPQKQANNSATLAIEKALTINPTLAAAYASKGLLLSVSDPMNAELLFKKAIELNPNYAMTYMWYGSLMQNAGDIGAAQKLFEQAFVLDPKSPVAAYNVAWCYYQVGAEEKAMDLFSQIISSDPYYPGAYNLVGDILTTRGRLDESVDMYKRALDVDPKNKGAIKGLLVATMDMGDVKATQQWFEYLNKQEEVFSLENINLIKARFYASQGDKNKAMNELKNIELSDDKIGMNDYILGEVAFYQGKYSQAIEAFERLRQAKSPNENYFYYLSEGQAAVHLAYAYLQIEALPLATTVIDAFSLFLENSKTKKSNNPDYYYNMALIKALQNKDSESYQYLQGAIDAGWIRAWQAEFEPIFSRLGDELQFTQMMGGVKARLAAMRKRSESEDAFLLADSET